VAVSSITEDDRGQNEVTIVIVSSPALHHPSHIGFELLFNEHVDSVFTVVRRMTWNRADAQDVTQNTFVRALTRIHQLDDPGKARPWLLSIAYREGLMALRRRREFPTDPSAIPDLCSTDPDPVDMVLRREFASIIGAAIDELSRDFGFQGATHPRDGELTLPA
jgi:DNA-directed RNA polymerase specialized sigma24 family protein